MNRNILIGAGVVAGLVVVALGGAAVAVSMQPDTLQIERSVQIDAPAEDVHAAVSDYEAFKAWSPWDYDPDMTVDISQPSSGVGATYAWQGNQDVGSGKMTTTLDEPLRVEQDLEFIEPFAGKARVAYVLVEGDGGTTLTWRMTQDLDFMGKAMGLLMDMDGMIGADFDKGLGRVKTGVEDGTWGAPEPEPEPEPEAEPVEDTDAGVAAGGAADADAPQGEPAGDSPG